MSVNEEILANRAALAKAKRKLFFARIKTFRAQMKLRFLRGLYALLVKLRRVA